MKRKWILIPAIVIAVLVVVILVGSYLAQEPLRRTLEEKMNSSLPGFSVQIQKLRLHPFALSADIENFWVYQKSHTDQPVVHIGRLHGGLHVLPLLKAQIVTDAEIDHPSLYVNLSYLEAVLKQKAPAAEKKEAWQDQLAAMHPVTVSEFRIEDGDITFQQTPEGEPIRISNIYFDARNIKNVKSAEGIYPTSLALDALLSGTGKLKMNGQADLMLKPMPGIKATMDLQGLDLTAYKQMAKLFSVNISKGVLSLAADLEYTPRAKRVNVRKLILREPEIDYIYAPQPAAKKPPSAKPTIEVRAETIRIEGGNFGIVNKTSNPTYRVFMSDTDLEVKNFSNEFSQGPATLYLKGQFMGTGDTVASGIFRPEANGPDFNIKLALTNTQMKDMNNLFRVYGNFDVSRGLFSFFAELTVKNNKVTGYVKPLFRDMKVYDKRKDKEKSEFRKLYEKAVGGVAKLLENRPRKAVATETPVKGSVANPKTSTWDALVNLVRNAFFQAILPGFERNIK